MLPWPMPIKHALCHHPPKHSHTHMHNHTHIAHTHTQLHGGSQHWGTVAPRLGANGLGPGRLPAALRKPFAGPHLGLKRQPPGRPPPQTHNHGQDTMTGSARDTPAVSLRLSVGQKAEAARHPRRAADAKAVHALEGGGATTQGGRSPLTTRRRAGSRGETGPRAAQNAHMAVDWWIQSIDLRRPTT